MKHSALILLFSLFTATLAFSFGRCGPEMRVIKTKLVKSTPTGVDAARSGTGRNLTTANPAFAEILDVLDMRGADSALILLESTPKGTLSDWHVSFLYGSIYTEQEEYSEAEKHFTQALVCPFENAATRGLIYLALARAFEKQLAYGKAQLNYMTALQLDSTLISAQAGLERVQSLAKKDARD